MKYAYQILGRGDGLWTAGMVAGGGSDAVGCGGVWCVDVWRGT